MTDSDRTPDLPPPPAAPEPAWTPEPARTPEPAWTPEPAPAAAMPPDPAADPAVAGSPLGMASNPIPTPPPAWPPATGEGSPFGAAGTPGLPPMPPPAPARSRRGVAVVTAVLAVVVGVGLKWVLPLVLVSSVSGVLGNVFGGPFDKLPSDQRDALGKRFEAAVGTQLDGLSDEASGAKVDELIRGGLPRLSDQLLVERIRLTITFMGKTDLASCASIARSTASGGSTDSAMSTAISTLDTASIGRWFDINITAIEAQSAGTPAVRAVDEASSSRVLGIIVDAMSPDEMTKLNELYGGGEVTDETACGAFRAFYGHIGELSSADIAIAALYDVAP